MKTRHLSKSGSRSRTRSRRSFRPRNYVLPGVVVDAGGLQCGWPRATPVDADEQRWLNEQCTLAVAASLEIHGPDAVDSLVIDITVIGRTAEQLWSAMPGTPSWTFLDVDALVARFERDMPGMHDTVVITLVAFVHWMRSHGHVSEADALVLLSRFQPHLPEYFFAMGYPRRALPASRQAS